MKDNPKIGLFFTSSCDEDLGIFVDTLEQSLEHIPETDIHICFSCDLDKLNNKYPNMKVNDFYHPLEALHPDLGCNCFDLNNCYKYLNELGCDVFVHLNDDIYFVRYWLEHLLNGFVDDHFIVLPNDGINKFPISNFHAFTNKSLKYLERKLPYIEENDPIQCYFLDTEYVLLAHFYRILRFAEFSYIIHQNHIVRPPQFKRENRQRIRTIDQDVPAFVRHMKDHKINPFRIMNFNFPMSDESKELLNSLKGFL